MILQPYIYRLELNRIRRAIPEQRIKKILDQIKEKTYVDLLTILKNIDQDFLKTTISGPKFKEYFFENCQDEEIAAYIKSVLG